MEIYSFSFPGLSLRGLFRGTDHILDLPHRHPGHQFPGAIQSSCTSLEVSDVLRGVFAGGRLLPGHHPIGRGCDPGAVLLDCW